MGRVSLELRGGGCLDVGIECRQIPRDMPFPEWWHVKAGAGPVFSVFADEVAEREVPPAWALRWPIKELNHDGYRVAFIILDRGSVARPLLDLLLTIMALTIVSHVPGAPLIGERPRE